MPIWIAWALAGVLASAEIAWIALAGVRVIGVAWWHPWVFGLLASALALRGRFPRIAASCAGIALSLILLPVAVFFVYLCATPGLPLADHVLAAADHALGFDWPAWFRLTTASKTIRLSLTMLYGWGWTIQLGALPLLLPIFSPCRHAEFLTINVTALLLISLGSMLMPAAGAPFYFGVVPAQFARAALIAGHETFLALRENPHLINIGWPQGVIAFPSYHAAGTVIFAYAVRGVRRLSRLSVSLNALILLSVPTIGGHYLVDVIAGVVIAGFTIVAVRALARVVSHEPAADLNTRSVPAREPRRSLPSSVYHTLKR